MNKKRFLLPYRMSMDIFVVGNRQGATKNNFEKSRKKDLTNRLSCCIIPAENKEEPPLSPARPERSRVNKPSQSLFLTFGVCRAESDLCAVIFLHFYLNGGVDD